MIKHLTKRNQPQNLDPEHAEIFNRSALYEVRNPIITRLSNVYICWQGQVFDHYKIYVESIPTELFLPKYGKTFFFRALASAWLRRRLVHIDTPCLVVHDEWSMNYFHWMTDALTRLYLVRNKLDELVLLLPESFKNDYHFAVLQKLGVKNILYTNERMLIRAKTLVLPNHTAPAGNYNPEILRNAVHLLCGHTDNQPVSGKTRIYVSRSRALVRKIMNEDDVQDLMKRLGFEILYMEEFSLNETIRIMHQAEILVSIHGAALTNMMFMNPGTCVLELRKQNLSDVYNSYFTLASVFGIYYYYLPCHSDDLSISEQKADLTVDLAQLEKTCRLIISRMP